MICQRCAKDVPNIHTCTSSDLVRKLEETAAALLAAIETHGHHKWCSRRTIAEMQRRGLFVAQALPPCDCSFRDVLAALAKDTSHE